MNEDYNNADFHDQKAGSREKPVLIFTHTSQSGSRHLFVGTKSKLAAYDAATEDWTIIATNKGAERGWWSAAGLGDSVVFTNNIDPVLLHNLGTTTTQTIPELVNQVKCRKARIAVQFYGFILLMNTEEDMGDGYKRYSSRVRWSDANDPNVWWPVPEEPDAGQEGNLANFQDLEYGDEILAAEKLGGNLMIYTARGIWRCYLQLGPANTSVFGFQRVYSEPKNSTGCIAYPRTLVSTGDNHFYMGRDAIYRYNAYTPQPERLGWIHAASAIIYDQSYPVTQIDSSFCEAPVSEYRPDIKELMFSWPDRNAQGSNNHTLYCNLQFQTCDYEDTGWTALGHYSPNEECQTATQVLIGASGIDWCLKELGGVYYREYVAPLDGNVENNITSPVYYAVGYNSILRGLAPLGYYDKEKRLRRVALEHETSDQETPCKVRLKIGRSFHAADANRSSGTCSPVWMDEGVKDLKCPDERTAESYIANNLKPSWDTHWTVWRQARYLHYEFSIEGDDGAPAVGAESCWSRVDFEASVAT